MALAKTYQEDDEHWALFLPRMRAAYPHVSVSQVAQAERLFVAARAHMSTLGKVLPPMQGGAYELDDLGGDCNGELVVAWNLRGEHHFSFEISRASMLKWCYFKWCYIDLRTQDYEWGAWDLPRSPEISDRAKHYLEMLGGG